MLEVGRLDIQARVGEAGWVVGRVMEALLISSKAAFASPSDPATRANLAALAKVPHTPCPLHICPTVVVVVLLTLACTPGAC